VHATTISTLGRDNNGVIRGNGIFIDGQYRNYKTTHVKNNTSLEHVVSSIAQKNLGLSGGKVNEKINMAVLFMFCASKNSDFRLADLRCFYWHVVK
jgi:hypothetical protein